MSNQHPSTGLRPEEIDVRPAVSTDFEAMATVMERAYAQRDSLPLPDSAQSHSIEEVATSLNKPNAWSHVAVMGDRAIGFAIGYPMPTAETGQASTKSEYLSLLMVNPDFWGRGIASRLLDIVEGRMHDAGREEILLWTRQANNERSQSFYERRQYRRTGTEKADGPYGPQYQYRLRL